MGERIHTYIMTIFAKLTRAIILFDCVSLGLEKAVYRPEIYRAWGDSVGRSLRNGKEFTVTEHGSEKRR
jgi:hypothetical protein